MKLKQLFCRHDYVPWANIEYPLSNLCKANTVLICKKCGKKKFIKKLIPAPMDYAAILDFYRMCFYTLPSDALDKCIKNIVKDRELFVKYFGHEFDEYLDEMLK